jgi:hypothetical protein
MSAIPATGEINVKDAPKITPLAFVTQILENIQAQINNVDEEFLSASGGSAEVRTAFLYPIY